MRGLKIFENDYFEGKEAPVNYGSLFYRINVWLRFGTVVHMLRRLNRYGGKILDVGCALGHSVNRFSREGYEAYGCDISRWATTEAKRLNAEINILRADANSLPFKHEAFDAVTAFETLEHCPRLDDVLNEIGRIVVSGGLIVVSVPTTDLNDTHADETHVWHLSLSEWIEILTKKFALVQIRYFLKFFKYIDRKTCDTFIVLARVP